VEPLCGREGKERKEGERRRGDRRVGERDRSGKEPP